MTRGVGVVRYSFTVGDLHPLLLAGLPAHSNKETDPKAQPSVPQGGLKGAMTRPSTASGLGRQPTKKLTDDELQKDDKLIS
jgi:hypothetical protein